MEEVTCGYQLSTMRTIISRMPTDSTGRSTAASVPAVLASISASSDTACAMLALHAAGAALRSKLCADPLNAGLLAKGACVAHTNASRAVSSLTGGAADGRSDCSDYNSSKLSSPGPCAGGKEVCTALQPRISSQGPVTGEQAAVPHCAKRTCAVAQSLPLHLSAEEPH